jgi:hypothetical protein
MKWLRWIFRCISILITVVTALLTTEGVKYLVGTRKQSRAAAARETASPNEPSTENGPT